jgi:hypothetical protein
MGSVGAAATRLNSSSWQGLWKAPQFVSALTPPRFYEVVALVKEYFRRERIG